MALKSTNSAARLPYAAIAFAAACAMAVPAVAADADLERFKAEIESFVGRLAPSTNGVVRSAASDAYDLRSDGDTLVAVINNISLSLGTSGDRLALDRIEIRQVGQKEGGKLIELGLQLPRQMTLKEADGAETMITLQNATANALVEAQSGRGRETVVAIAGARLEQTNTGARVSIGPLSLASKLSAEPDGGWSGPVDFEIRNLDFSLPQLPLSGGISGIAFHGRSAGPSIERIDRLRETIDRVRAADGQPSEARAAALLAALSSMAAPFSSISGDFLVDGLTARDVAGDAFVSLAAAEITIAITGLDSAEAALRFSLRHDGLELSPSILEPSKVPRRARFDLGIEHISTAALAQLLRAAGTIAEADGKDEKEPRQRQAFGQILGAAALLNPTFRIHDFAVDTADFGIDLTAEATGSLLAPTEYTATGELAVRGFDNLAKLGPQLPFLEYLPVLEELGKAQTASDGTQRTMFRLASAPPKWLTINGNDVAAWFDRPEERPDQPRKLALSDPPMRGEDVERVQRALAAGKIAVDEDGVYSSGTAGAVARFQKQSGINVSGVVDAATRQRLAISAQGPRQGGRN